MDDDLAARWGEWGGVEVELPIDEGVGRNFWLESGSLEEVECHDRLGDEEVPAISWECRVCPTQHRDEVCFKRFDCTFGWVVPMVAWGDELVFDFCFFFDVFDEDFRNFIVHPDDFCMESVPGEMVIGFLESSLDLRGFF